MTIGVRIGLLVVFAVAASGCLRDTRSRCDTGEVCPGSMLCAPNGGGCVLPEQLQRCMGHDDGDSCQFPGNPSGVCREGVCRGTVCGDTVVDPGEQCDDGNLVAGDGCSADCSSDERCGNGVIDNGEDCDCGDGSVALPELCQGSNDDRVGTCNRFCQLNCGDAMLDPGETCDIGVLASDGESQPTCASFGFDRGRLRCSSLCGVDPLECERMGWRSIGVGFFGNDVGFLDPPTRVVTAWVDGDGTMSFFADQGHIASRRPGEPSAITHSGSALSAVSAAPNGALFGVGDAGLILERNPAWVTHTAPTAANLRGVWAFSSNRVFAVGDAGTIVSFDGLFWSLLPSPTSADLNAVHGAGVSEAYAVGDGGIILRYDGAGWQAESSGTSEDLTAVWMAGGVPFAVGDGGAVVRRGPTGWQALSSGTSADLTTVWGVASDDVLAGGALGTLLHFDGQRWRPIETDLQLDMVAIRGNADGVVIAAATDVNVALSYAGSMWFTDPSSTTEDLRDVAATADGGFIAVGDNGTIVRQTAQGWTPVVSPVSSDLLGVWVGDPDTVVIVGDAGVVLTLEEGGLAAQVVHPEARLEAVWGTGPSDLFAVGVLSGPTTAGGTAAALFHYDGVEWTNQAVAPSLARYHFLDVWGVDGTNVIAVGTGTGAFAAGIIARYDGSAWHVEQSRPATGGSVDAVWGSDAEHVYASTLSGDLLLYDGSTWSTVGRIARVGAIAGTAGDDVFAAGARATLFDPVSSAPVFHYDGRYTGPTFLSAIAYVDSATSMSLYGVAAASRSVAFVGEAGVIRTLIRSTPWSSAP